VSLTKVSPSLFATSNNITSVTVGGSANTISLTFDGSGVITSATNNAVSVANTAITGNIISSQITSVANTQITGNITAAQITSVANTQLTGLIQAAQIGSANATLVTSGTLPTARLPSGTVLQVVSSTFTTQVSITATSDTDIGLTATITPSSASNKILVIASVVMYGYGSPSVNVTSGWRIKTSADVVVIGGTLFTSSLYQSSTTYNLHSTTAKHILHSPATTSAITYKLTGRCNGAVGAVFNYTEGSDAPSSVLTLMEIAA